MDINATTLVGRLVRDPELKQLSDSMMVANFTLAANHGYMTKDGLQKEEVAYVSCVVFGKPAAWAGEHKKGESVAVSGHLVSESWQQDGKTRWCLRLRVKDIQFFKRTNGETPVLPKDTGDDLPF